MGQGQGKTGREGIELVRDRLSDSDLTSAAAGFGSAVSGSSSVTWETSIFSFSQFSLSKRKVSAN